MNFKITLLPGDGIGPEVVGEAVRVLETVASKYKHTFDFQERLMGGCSIDKYGSSLTDETLADCQSHPTPCCLARSADRNGTTPKPKTAPSAACLPCAKGWACLPTCARSKSTPP
jgi:3-isopropylmalate dehydrogenase